MAPDIRENIEKLYGSIDNLPSIENIQDQFKTGDLIFLSGDNYGSKSIRWATSSYWSHIAMVLALPGNKEYSLPYDKSELYLWECDVGQNARGGARLIKLSQKLLNHQGYKVGAWKKYKSKKIELNKIIQFINKYSGKILLQNRIYSYIFSRYGPKFLYKKVKNKGKWYCSELIARTYQYLGILNKEIDPCSISPEDFYNSRKGKNKEIKELFNSSIFFKF